MIRTSPSPRQLRRAETLARITDEALEIATTEGLQALTIARLARDLGYAVGALYRYFPSKDAILLAVQGRVVRAIEADLEAARQRVDAYADRSRSVGPPERALLHLLVAGEVYLSLGERRPAHFRLLAFFLGDTEPVVADDAAEPILPVMMALMAHVANLFEAAVDARVLVDGNAATRALCFWGALHGVAQLRKLGRFGIDAIDPDAARLATMHALLTGWGAAAPSLDELHPRASRLCKELWS